MNYKKIYAIKKQNENRILKVNPEVNNQSGIYMLTRVENGFAYAYIGQSVNLLERLGNHLNGYQHIDLSIKKHKLFSLENPTGWMIGFKNYPVDKLDEMEQTIILAYANKGYQLLNKTSGSQGEGKQKIANFKEKKGYQAGLHQGRKNLAKELKHIIDLHLVVDVKKQGNKNHEKALAKFLDLIDISEE